MSHESPAPGRPWLIANAVFGVLFVFSALVNLNDPDPVVWVLLYGLGAYGCALDAMGRLSGASAGVTAGGYWILAAMVGWAGRHGSQDMKGFPQFGVFAQEMVREALGLGLVALWMSVLFVRLYREDR